MVETIIPYNQSLQATPYTMFHLPPFVPGTDGVAAPKPEATATLCVAPGDATTYNPNWQQELTLHPGVPHLALAANDTYPNQAFGRDYTVTGPVGRRDPLAKVLKDFWSSRGYGNDELRAAWLGYLDTFSKPLPWMAQVRAQVMSGQYFFNAKKERPIVVRGVVDLRFTTSEGPTLVEHGSVLVEHWDDPTNQWLIRAGNFAKRYDWVKAPSSGLLIPDT